MDSYLEVRDVTFRYPHPNPTLALREVNLILEKGEFTALIGHNGSGKTTLVKHLIGLLRPTAGQILLKGTDIASYGVAQLARTTGYVFQNPDRQIFRDEVLDEVMFGLRQQEIPPEICEQRAIEALRRLNVDHLARRNVFTLSRGQRQRVAIASILALETEVLLIDEPTTGQDPGEARRIMELLKDVNASEVTVLVITHDMSLVSEYVPRTIALHNGEILADGPTREVFSQPDLLELTSVETPQITRLGLMTVGEPWLSVDEAERMLLGIIGHKAAK